MSRTQLFARAQVKGLEDSEELISSLAAAIYGGDRTATGLLRAMYERGFVEGGRAMSSIVEATDDDAI